MEQKKKGTIGLSFDAFLAEEGILEICEEQALKQILAGLRSCCEGPQCVRDGRTC